MLYSDLQNNQFREIQPKDNQPVVVFLHGLLGNGTDWQSCLSQLSNYSTLILDLAGHGKSVDILCTGFAECCEQIETAILSQVGASTPIILVGYSMGGRIAMVGCANGHFARLNVKGLVVEGGNFGLSNQADKSARLLNDRHWATRFEFEPIEQVLVDWYQQAVFSSLNHEQRQHLVEKRSNNNGKSIARMLLATSLSRQSDIRSALNNANLPICYLCGEKDKKFHQLAKESGLDYRVIAQAGHNVHQEQPTAFVQELKSFIETRVGEL